MLKLKIVLENEDWVLVDKPARFHTHPPEDKRVRVLPRWNALGILERQLGMPLYPMHRLDRATSGLLLYSKRREVNETLQKQFSSRTVGKTYFALVRGECREEAILDEPLTGKSGELKEAKTLVSPVVVFTLPLPHPQGGDRKFTFVRAVPHTGRFHQIRRHLARVGLPILGDSRHGDKKLNREFATLTGSDQLFLRCMGLAFECPRTGQRIETWARWGKDWHKFFELAGVCPFTSSPSRARPSPF